MEFWGFFLWSVDSSTSFSHHNIGICDFLKDCYLKIFSCDTWVLVIGHSQTFWWLVWALYIGFIGPCCLWWYLFYSMLWSCVGLCWLLVRSGMLFAFFILSSLLYCLSHSISVYTFTFSAAEFSTCLLMVDFEIKTHPQYLQGNPGNFSIFKLYIFSIFLWGMYSEIFLFINILSMWCSSWENFWSSSNVSVPVDVHSQSCAVLIWYPSSSCIHRLFMYYIILLLGFYWCLPPGIQPLGA